MRTHAQAPATTRSGRCGITAFIAAGGTIEKAQQIAGHASMEDDAVFTTGRLTKSRLMRIELIAI